jgi:GntR family transcriptional regulator
MAEPMWRQIAEDLREKIESGELGAGDEPLPSELKLQETYLASRNTVREAVKWLATRGLVITRPGQGSFAARKIDPFVTTLPTTIGAPAQTVSFASEVTAGPRIPQVGMPRVEIQPASGLVAAELRLAEGSSVVSRYQERFIDGTPWSLQTSFYPMSLVEQGASAFLRAEEIAVGQVAYIEERLNIRQAGTRDRIAVRAPDWRECDFFRLPDDGRVAVIEQVQTGYDQSGAPFRLTITRYPGDRNQFVLSVGDVPPEETL